MTVVDSSGWIEIFTGGRLASKFRQRLEGAEALVVPTIVLYEVYRVIRREASEEEADEAAAYLRGLTLIPLDDRLALEAADYSLRHKLSLADAVVYATAQAHHATLVTSDEHFQGLPGVEYVGEAAA